MPWRFGSVPGGCCRVQVRVCWANLFHVQFPWAHFPERRELARPRSPASREIESRSRGSSHASTMRFGRSLTCTQTYPARAARQQAGQGATLRAACLERCRQVLHRRTSRARNRARSAVRHDLTSLHYTCATSRKCMMARIVSHSVTRCTL